MSKASDYGDHTIPIRASEVAKANADLLLQLPDGQFKRREIDLEVVRENVDHWANKGVLIQETRPLGKSEPAEYRLRPECRELARSVVENRDPSETWPCHHPGISHTDDGYTCGKEWCNYEWERDDFGRAAVEYPSVDSLTPQEAIADD